MLTLGLAHDVFISSAALVRDGEVLAAVAEERLNRRKQFKGFPAAAIKECLKLGGARLQDLDEIAVAWNPARHMAFANQRWSGNARWRPEYLYAIPNQLIGTFGLPAPETIEQQLDGLTPKISYVDHHVAHVATAFHLSGWERAALASLDGRGEADTSWFGTGGPAGLQKAWSVTFPHSLGLVYGAVTQFLGHRPDGDEWKVMALASFGDPDTDAYRKLRGMITVDPDGRFFVDNRYFVYGDSESYGGRFYSPDFASLFGAPRVQDAPYTKRDEDLAAALQRVFEESMAALLTTLAKRTGETRLCAAGGCMMNSVYNGKITSTTPFRELFVPSCPDDSGVSIGAALWASHRHGGRPPRAHPHNYWGASFAADEVEKTLRAYKLTAERLPDPAATAAKLLAEGKLIGWFQGRAEFGQRALGNRSILVDPRRADGKDIVNAAVKYREAFRPFAPAILAHRAEEWFQVEPGASVPFMERVWQFRPEKRAAVPAVVHVDGSGRLQTVTPEANPRFHALISAFERLTGVPIVLNTSFNLNGEPIVHTPTDAIRTYVSCGLDALIVEDFLLRK